MVKTKMSRIVALAAAALLVAAACGNGDDDAGTDEPATEATADPEEPAGDGGDGALQFGYLLPETGDLAYLGDPQIAAAEFAIDEINQQGGVLGEDLPQIIGSDESDNQSVADQSADSLLGQNVDVVIGAASSGMSLAVIDKITGAETLQCSGSNTAPTFTDYDDGGYYFRTAPSDALQGPVLANAIIDDGYQAVAIVARADDYGRGLADATAEALEAAGATVTLNETYDPQAGNFSAPVGSALDSNPDAIVVIAFEEGTQILADLLESGWEPDALYGTDGLRNEELGELVAPGQPEAIAGMRGTAPASADNPDFISELQEFSSELDVVQFAPQVYDCVLTMALAAELAGTDDPAVVKDHVVDVTKDGEACTTFEECRELIEAGTDIDYNGRSGPLDFTDDGEPGLATIEVYGFDDTGQLETLRSEDSEPLDN